MLALRTEGTAQISLQNIRIVMYQCLVWLQMDSVTDSHTSPRTAEMTAVSVSKGLFMSNSQSSVWSSHNSLFSIKAIVDSAMRPIQTLLVMASAMVSNTCQPPVL
jgi:hypothetical protein